MAVVQTLDELVCEFLPGLVVSPFAPLDGGAQGSGGERRGKGRQTEEKVEKIVAHLDHCGSQTVFVAYRIHIFLQIHIEKFENEVEFGIRMDDVEESTSNDAKALAVEQLYSWLDALDDIVVLAQLLQ